MKKFKTEHPIIKEISIGDQFITYDGEIVTFVEYFYQDKDIIYPILMSNKFFYTRKLTFLVDGRKRRLLNINYKIANLKDKIDLL